MFDGDALSIIIIFEDKLIRSWEQVHSPTFHFISPYSGKFSGNCKFIKDTAIILCELWDMGKNRTYYEQWATEAERNKFLCKVSEA